MQIQKVYDNWNWRGPCQNTDFLYKAYIVQRRITNALHNESTIKNK